MTSGRTHRQAYIACDTCPETVEGSDFNDLWNSARADGWKAKRVEGTWEHVCPSCADDFNRVKIVPQSQSKE